MGMVRATVQVSLSEDGRYVATGWPFSANEYGLKPSIGRVEVYATQQDEDRDQEGTTNATWSRVGNSLYRRSSEDFFGSSISLNGNGGIVAVGSAGNQVSSRLMTFCSCCLFAYTNYCRSCLFSCNMILLNRATPIYFPSTTTLKPMGATW
jgi:hypothetical protein